MLHFPQNGRRRKNTPAQHTLVACIESLDRCGTAAPQRHSFTMPPTAYRPAQDGRLAAQRPLGCWAAAAQIPIHRQIRRADLACLLNISEAIYDGCSNTKACPSCARKIRARLTRCLHPTCHRWSAAPAKTRRRVLAGAAGRRPPPPPPRTHHNPTDSPHRSTHTPPDHQQPQRPGQGVPGGRAPRARGVPPGRDTAFILPELALFSARNVLHPFGFSRLPPYRILSAGRLRCTAPL